MNTATPASHSSPAPAAASAAAPRCKLAEHGSDLILTYKSSEAEAQAVVRQIEALGRRAVALQLDVGRQRQLRRLRRAREGARSPRPGSASASTTSSTTPASASTRIVRGDHRGAVRPAGRTSTSRAPFFLTQKLLPLIADGGRIVNMSTGLARFTFPGYAAYAAMKGGIEVLTRYLAKELGPRGITVNTIAPGAIETDFGGGAVRDNAAGSTRTSPRSTALGRVGLPDDIGGAVAALLSDGNRWINGQRIEVSGGMLL